MTKKLFLTFVLFLPFIAASTEGVKAMEPESQATCDAYYQAAVDACKSVDSAKRRKCERDAHFRYDKCVKHTIK